jgi:hypothetical protein
MKLTYYFDYRYTFAKGGNMKSFKTFSVSLGALVYLASLTNLDATFSGAVDSASTELMSAEVEASLADNKINVTWGSLSRGNQLEVSINGEQKFFVNESGLLGQVAAIPGENRIEVTEVKPIADTETLKNSESFQTRLLILGSNQHSFGGGGVAYGAESLPGATRLRYQTFIRNKYVEVDASSNCIPWLTWGKRHAFGGDNRGFNPDSSQFRTRFDVRIDWLEGGNQVALTSVGQSKTYEWNDTLPVSDKWQLTGETTQSTAGMGLTSISETPSLVHFKMDHNISDPFCLWVNPVSYNLDVYISRSGTYTITGTRNRVPDHEVYIRTDVKPDWAVIYQRENYSYNCLWPVYLDLACTASPNVQSVNF